MSKTSRCLGRSLVLRLCYRSTICLVAFTFCTFLPLFSFGDIRARIKYFSSVGSTNVTYSLITGLADETSLYFAYYNSTFGVCLYHSGIASPSSSSSSSSWTSILNNQISPTGNSFTNSPAHYPRVWDLYITVQSLINSGYNGPGIIPIFSGSRHCYNVNFPTLVADVLSSTNTVFRQQLLSHLIQMNNLIVNIDSNVSTLSPQVDQIREVNTSILSLLGEVYSNSVDSASVLSSNIVNLSSSFDSSHPLALSSFTNLINAAFDSSLISNDKYQDWLSQISDSSMSEDQLHILHDEILSTIRSANSVYGFFQGLENSISRDGPTVRNALRSSGSFLNEGVVDALIGDYPETRGGSKSVNSRTSIKSQLRAWRNEAKQQLNDWKADLKQDLQDWKTSDATGYLNIKNSIDDNFSYTDRGSTNRLPYTSFVTNYVTRTVTNSIQQSSADIQTNATANTDRHIESDSNRWDEFKDLVTGDGDGLNVRIKFPLWEQNPEYHVMVHDDTLLPVVTTLSDDLKGLVDVVDGGAWHVELDGLPADLLDFLGVITNYYVDYNSTTPAADIAQGFLSNGFDFQSYSALPWFERVEVLLAMIANIDSTNSVEVADIRESMEEQVSDFQSLSTNIVSVSSDVVGLFHYVQRFSYSLQSIFGDRAAPLTGDYVLLAPGHWIGNEPLVLRVNPNIQNLCRLIMQCIWYLGFLVLLWLVVNWCWQKVVAVLRWLWSMFDV